MRAFIVAAIVLAAMPSATICLADDVRPSNANRTFFGYEYLRNTGLDNGYSGQEMLKSDDVHYNWALGRFFVGGYTRGIDNGDGSFTFLKNVGDTVSLSFILDQDIDSLNGNPDISVSDDENGYDERMGVLKQDFGRGTLIVKKTDNQNQASDPTVYVDYLAGKRVGADTDVGLYEEGDYQVCLDYELKHPGMLPFLPAYSNYRIEFDFSVRNGNAMLYLFDIATGNELTNSAFTESGFRVDLANSEYLDLDVKREVLNDSKDGLETRFSRPATSGEEFTEDGVYTLTVTNRYTNLSTSKKIYVGEDPVMKVYAIKAEGMTLGEIRDAIAAGATVGEDGTLIMPSGPSNEKTESATATKKVESANDGSVSVVVAVVVVAIVALVATLMAVLKRKRKSKKLVSADESAIEVNHSESHD